MEKEPKYFVKQDINKSSLFKGSKPLLLKLDIELTERCNNNCIHCCINLPANDQETKRKELSTREIKDILIEAAALGCLTVRFTGGEPLLRYDFEDLYIFARKLGLKEMLFTNGRLITQRLADLFERIPPLEKIEITLYGMKKESYDEAVQISGAFEQTWRGINLLLEKKIPFIVKGSLLPSNINEIEQFEKWALTIPWMNKKPQYSMFFDLRCRRDSEDKNNQIRQIRLTPEEGLAILTRNKEKYLSEMKQFCSKFTRPPGDKLFSCGAGRGGGCVDAYGNLQLCLMLRHPDTIFSLKGHSLKEIITGSFPKVQELKAKNPEYLTRCARCFLKGLCEQCPAKSWMEHGTLDTPVEYLCKNAHVQAEYLGLLKANEKAWTVENWKVRIENFVKKEKPEEDLNGR